MSIQDVAKETVVDTAQGIARLIADVHESRRLEPHYWAAYHEVQHRSLPRWRWLARWHHLRMSRRYRSHIVAKRRSQR